MTDNNKSTPKCVGFIMDGNRRWAKKHKLPIFKGHEEGYKTLRKTVEWAVSGGVKNLIIYAFSTENWRRSKTEVNALMYMFGWIMDNELNFLKDKGVRVLIIGQTDRLPKVLKKKVELIEKNTKNCSNITVSIAISYGGRVEIVEAMQHIIDKRIKHVSEKIVEQNLWTKNTPDPDLIIRTGGQMRLSNFLLWQSAYSELFFTNTLWPDFSKKEFDGILNEFRKRKQNWGK